MGTPRHSALEAQILAAPEDERAWLVYADWLQQQGAPRGELIQLDAERRRGVMPERERELAAAERALLERTGLDAHPGAQVRRAFGFATALTLTYAQEGDDAPHLEELLSGVLVDDDLRYLRELSLQTLRAGDWSTALRLLCERAPPLLDTLLLYARETGELRAGDVLPAQVRAVRLEAGHLRLERLDWPGVRALELDAVTLAPDVPAVLARSALPSLESLSLSARLVAPRPVVAPLVTGAQWRSLRALELHGLLLGAQDGHALATSALTRLETLDVSECRGVAEAGLAALARRVPPLRRVTARRCGLTPETAGALQRALRGAVVVT